MRFAGKVILGTILVVVVLIALVAACSAAFLASDEGEVLNDQPGVVKVIAPDGRCWTGAIVDRSEEGCGPKDFPIQDEAIIVANAQKETPGRWTLELVLEVDGEEVDRNQTTARFGVATVSE